MLNVKHVQARDEFLLWDWEGHHQERVEGDRNSVADGADESRLVLSVKQIQDDALVTIDVFVPRFQTGFLICLTISFCLLNIRLFRLLVKIFSHEIEDRIDALLRIMLTISLKSSVVLAQNSFEKIRSDHF